MTFYWIKFSIIMYHTKYIYTIYIHYIVAIMHTNILTQHRKLNFYFMYTFKSSNFILYSCNSQIEVIFLTSTFKKKLNKWNKKHSKRLYRKCVHFQSEILNIAITTIKCKLDKLSFQVIKPCSRYYLNQHGLW